MKKGTYRRKPYGFLRNVIFFLNVLIALLIIFGSWFLTETEFGKAAMLFGFAMIVVSTVLKIVQKW